MEFNKVLVSVVFRLIDVDLQSTAHDFSHFKCPTALLLVHLQGGTIMATKLFWKFCFTLDRKLIRIHISLLAL